MTYEHDTQAFLSCSWTLSATWFQSWSVSAFNFSCNCARRATAAESTRHRGKSLPVCGARLPDSSLQPKRRVRLRLRLSHTLPSDARTDTGNIVPPDRNSMVRPGACRAVARLQRRPSGMTGVRAVDTGAAADHPLLCGEICGRNSADFAVR